MRSIILRVFLGSLFLFVWGSCGDKENSDKRPEVHNSALDSLSVELSNLLDTSIIPGFAVSLVQNETILFNEGFGYSDIANKTPFTEHTAHTIASISKTFIAIAVMQLVETGQLRLDQNINEILPFDIDNPHFPDTPITVKHLVTHTSSINDDFDDGDKRASWLIEPLPKDFDSLHPDVKEDIFYFDGSETTLQDYLVSFCTTNGKWYRKSNFSEFRPGTKYEYSNAGATVAALIVEIISKSSFSDYTQKNILDPLGMHNTSWFYNDLDVPYSKLYVEKDGELNEFPRYHEASYPDGQLKTTSSDLTKYLIDMIKGCQGKGELLQPKSYSLMFEHQLQKNAFDERGTEKFNDDSGVGVFWAISEPGYRLHIGGMMGVYSILYFNPTSGIGITAFCNAAHPDFGKILDVLETYEIAIEKGEHHKSLK